MDDIINPIYLFDLNDKNNRSDNSTIFTYKNINGFYDMKINKDELIFEDLKYNNFTKIDSLEEIKKIRNLKNSILKKFIFRVEKDDKVYIMKNDNLVLNVKNYFKGYNKDNLEFKREYNSLFERYNQKLKEINNIKGKFLNKEFKILNSNIENIIPNKIIINEDNTKLLEDEFTNIPLKSDTIRIKKNKDSILKIKIFNNKIINIIEIKNILSKENIVDYDGLNYNDENFININQVYQKSKKTIIDNDKNTNINKKSFESDKIIEPINDNDYNKINKLINYNGIIEFIDYNNIKDYFIKIIDDTLFSDIKQLKEYDIINIKNNKIVLENKRGNIKGNEYGFNKNEKLEINLEYSNISYFKPLYTKENIGEYIDIEINSEGYFINKIHKINWKKNTNINKSDEKNYNKKENNKCRREYRR